MEGRWEDQRAGQTEGRWEDQRADRTEDRWGGPRADRTEGRWGGLRTVGCWGVLEGLTPPRWAEDWVALRERLRSLLASA